MGRSELRAQVDAALAAASRSQDAVGKALLATDPSLLVAAAEDFQRAVATLSERVQRLRQEGPLPATLQSSLREIMRAVGLQREACVRRGAYADQAVESLLPGAAATPVYGQHASPYGAGQRRTGTFKVLSA